MEKFTVQHPSFGFYGADFYAHNKQEARAAARKFYGVKKLPNNTAVYKRGN